MAGELVQSRMGNASVSGTTYSFAYTGNTAAGNTLVVIAASDQASGTITITDSQNNFYAIQTSFQDATLHTAVMGVAFGCFAAANTVTLTTSVSTTFQELTLMEWTAASTGGEVDQTASATGNSAAPSSGAKTTGVNTEVVIGYVSPGGTATVGTGFTSIQSLSGSMSEYQIQTTAGSIAAAWTQSPSAIWGCLMLTLRPLASIRKHRFSALGVGL